MTTNQIARSTIHFSGHVQGVGFRYQVFQLAKGYEVVGFVQNLMDGRVLLDVEGARDELTAFVADIEREMSGYIRSTERHDSTGAGRYSAFTIR